MPEFCVCMEQDFGAGHLNESQDRKRLHLFYRQPLARFK